MDKFADTHSLHSSPAVCLKKPGSTSDIEINLLAANPALRCLTPPTPPFSFGVEGSFTCDPVNGRPGGGWNLGDTCDYHCPEG